MNRDQGRKLKSIEDLAQLKGFVWKIAIKVLQQTVLMLYRQITRPAFSSSRAFNFQLKLW